MTAKPPKAYPELDSMLSRVSAVQRAAILHEVTDLFLEDPFAYSERQIAKFDIIMRSLTVHVEATALIKLGARLVETDAAPVNVILRLSNDDDIAVARLVLERSTVLSDDHLISTARSKSQNHLLAIAGRTRIAVVVSDVLVDRGNLAVMQRVTGNAGADISERGFCRLISRAGDDQELANLVAHRQDMPPELLPFLKQSMAKAKALANARQAVQVVPA